MATLSTEQQAIARQWIADGMKLSDFQRRLETDFTLKLTYMEVRFLIDDLKVLPKDPEPPKAPPALASPQAPAAGAPVGAVEPDEGVPPHDALGGGAGVQVTVDAVTRPKAMVSGRVRFSDGKGASWLIDHYGRPNLVADEKGYRPSQPDLLAFQAALERELSKLGF